MPFYPSSDALSLVTRAQLALRMNQRELAELLGISRRTVTRWYANQSSLSVGEVEKIARAVFPVDATLAAGLAAECGKTLESMGLVRHEPPAPVVVPLAVPSAPPPRAYPPIAPMVESIVCAAVEVTQSTPAAARGVVRAVFARARALGLTVQEVDDAFSLAPDKK
jgi:transcriptional regulator with XRE-family HTH domain